MRDSVGSHRRYLRSLARLWAHRPVADVEVRVNARLSATAGRFLPAAELIEVSQAFMARPTAVQREIICHEAAHLVVDHRYGRSARPHGVEWSALIRAAGFTPRASLVRCGTTGPARPTTVQLAHVCTVCHFSRRAKRRTPRWRCPDCRAIGLDGALSIMRVSSDK